MQGIENNPFFYSGKTVIIRPLTPDDAPLVYSWMQEKFFSYYKPYLKRICSTVSSLAQRIQSRASLNTPFEIEALVCYRPSHTPIGLVSLSNIDTINLKAEFSIAFHRGLGTRCVAETLGFLFHYVFFTLKFNKLYFYVTADNDKILRMIQHYDFLQEGKLYKEVLSETGEWLDLYRFCILRQHWLEGALYKKLKKIMDYFR
jgi:RimJ/RimL family protein N-acetyltransferase